jgi:hypothetical protein
MNILLVCPPFFPEEEGGERGALVGVWAYRFVEIGNLASLF